MTKSEDEIYKVEEAGDEDPAYGAPTKVGPMSLALVAKMMQDAEQAGTAAPASAPTSAEQKKKLPPVTPPPKSTSGIRAAMLESSVRTSSTSDLPAPYDDDDFLPTTLNENARAAGAAAAAAAVAAAQPTAATTTTAATAPQRVDVVGAIVNQMVLGSDDEDEDETEEKEIVKPPLATLTDEVKAVVEATPTSPTKTTGARAAAFPDWLKLYAGNDEILHPKAKTDRRFLLQILAGVGAFAIATSIIVWWLFSVG